MSGHTGPLLYNPALLSREELIGSFLVRQEELCEILGRVRAAAPSHAPQHLLVLGFRGMGKTTLLHRLAYAVEDEPDLSPHWLPVLFDEEQFNVGELADFWLNALEMLSHAADRPELLQQAQELPNRYGDEALEEAAYDALRAAARDLDRRLLLLVDNIDLVFDRIDPDREASRLREVLQHQPWLMLVGTSSRAIESTYDYGQPFYEMFKLVELDPMSETETLRLLAGLAERYGAPEVAELVTERPGKVAKIQTLMGGNPRTVALLFGVLQEGPDGDLWTQLERLLDGCTSLYKDRLESLPVQSQRVFDALAQHWHPATAEMLTERLRLGRGAVSGQLHRLVDKGLVEKVKLPGRAIGFQVRERFFNIWCLMRGGRRSRQRLRWLVEFIEIFYDSHRVQTEAERVHFELKGIIEASSAERRIQYAEILIPFLDNSLPQAQLYYEILQTSKRLDLSTGHLNHDLLMEVALAEDLGADQALQLAKALDEVGISGTELQRRRLSLLLSQPDWETKQIDGVLAELVKLVRGGDPGGLRASGYLLLLTGQLDIALRVVKTLTDHCPNDPFVWELLGNVHLARAESTASIQAFRRGLEVDSKDAGLVLSLASLGFAGFPVGAFDVEPRELRQSFSFDLLPTARLALAFQAATKGDAAEARKLLQKVSILLKEDRVLTFASVIAIVADADEYALDCISKLPPEFDSVQLAQRFIFYIPVLSSLEENSARSKLSRLIRARLSNDEASATVLLLLLFLLPPADVAEMMDARGWSVRFEPLRDALAVWSGEDPDRFARLAPEVRQVSEDLLRVCKMGVRKVWSRSAGKALSR